MGLMENFKKEQKKGLQEDGRDIGVEGLENEFNDYAFKVHLLSYVKKTIAFSSIEIKKKAQEIRQREECNLNVIDANFNEERIMLLKGSEGDFAEELFLCKENNGDYGELSHRREVIKALNSLTSRQREIIYRCIIMGEKDTQVAKKLGITKQGVNKTKITSLNKLRRLLAKSVGRNT